MDQAKVGVDRTGMMERYQEAMGIVVEPEVPTKAPEVAEASSDSANKKSQSEAPPEGEHTVTDPKEPVAKEVAKSDPGVKKEVENHEEPKTVPLEALHEAREKFKAKNLEARKLTEQLSAKDQELLDVKTRLAALEDTIRKAKAGEMEDPEAEEKARLVAENAKLKDTQAKLEKDRLIKTKEDAARETARLITVADETLSKEGFPGFQRFGRDVYDAIVAKIKAGEIEEKDVTTDMWAKVYKEEVYPQVKAVFASQTEQEKLAAKRKQKEAAKLVGNPGEGPTPKEDEDLDAPQTPQSYMSIRKTLK